MKKQTDFKTVRLQVAISLATVEQPTAEQKLILNEICKADPVIKNYLEYMGVKID